MANKRNDRKDIRREEAAERQAEWDALTSDQKLAKVAERIGPFDDVQETNEARKIKADR